MTQRREFVQGLVGDYLRKHAISRLGTPLLSVQGTDP